MMYLIDCLFSTSAVRDDILNEGSMPAEDHCRVCHKMGDMVICEHCNGPFHGTCLDPPMYEVSCVIKAELLFYFTLCKPMFYPSFILKRIYHLTYEFRSFVFKFCLNP